MNIQTIDPEKLPAVKRWIRIVSIVIPVAVAALFKVKIPGIDLSFLPGIYAFINGLTALCLILALRAIKQKKVETHRAYIRTSLFLSIIFLLLYVAYHMTSNPTLYGDTNHSGSLDILEKSEVGLMMWVYYFILFTHILLSVVVIPIVLFTYLFAWQGNFEKHKRWTRFAFPMWLYVAVTGVIVYLMIAPFYT
jgi:putative membrane protein